MNVIEYEKKVDHFSEYCKWCTNFASTYFDEDHPYRVERECNQCRPTKFFADKNMLKHAVMKYIEDKEMTDTFSLITSFPWFIRNEVDLILRESLPKEYVLTQVIKRRDTNV